MSTEPDSSTSKFSGTGAGFINKTRQASVENFLRKVADFYWQLDARYAIHARLMAFYEVMKLNPIAAFFFGVIAAACCLPICGFIAFFLTVVVGHIVFFSFSLILFIGFGFSALFIALVTAAIIGFFVACVLVTVWIISERIGRVVKKGRNYLNTPGSAAAF